MLSLRWRACSKKKSYGTKNRARFVAAWVRKHRGELVEAYKCKFGKHYHIGHIRDIP